jgi:hypothetical protein
MLADIIAAAVTRADYNLNTVLLARTYEAVNPGQLRAVNGAFWVGPARCDWRALYAAAKLPGVRFTFLQMDDTHGNVGIGDLPASLIDGSADIRQFGGLIRSINVDILTTLHSLWDKVGKAGFYSADQIKLAHTILKAGTIAVPASASTLETNAPSLSPDQYEPPGLTPATRDAWVKICGEFQATMVNYYKKDLQAALDRGRLLDLNVAFWDAIYTTCKVVSDLPATIAGGVLSAVWGTFARGPILLLAGLVAAGAAVWFFWPELFAAAKVARAKRAEGAAHG